MLRLHAGMHSFRISRSCVGGVGVYALTFLMVKASEAITNSSLYNVKLSLFVGWRICVSCQFIFTPDTNGCIEPVGQLQLTHEKCFDQANN